MKHFFFIEKTKNHYISSHRWNSRIRAGFVDLQNIEFHNVVDCVVYCRFSPKSICLFLKRLRINPIEEASMNSNTQSIETKRKHFATYNLIDSVKSF